MDRPEPTSIPTASSMPLTAGVASRIVRVASTGSTNADLVAGAAAYSSYTVLIADEQTAGRGRLDRLWIAPVGKTMTASILVRPVAPRGGALDPGMWGWFPLLAGLALHDVVSALVPGGDVGLKWPNDVQIDGRKLSGILAELVVVDGRPDSVVIGVGLNLTLTEDDLPTPTATSLSLAGAPGAAAQLEDAVLSSFLVRVKEEVELLVGVSGDAEAAGLVERVSAVCTTLGRRVRVELPDGTAPTGVARSIDGSGRLVVLGDGSSLPMSVAAGDVTHLRYE